MLILAANSTSTLNDVEPGLLGFLVVAALGLALYFLLRSMNKHLRKVAANAEETDAEGASAPATQRPLRGLAAHRAAMAAQAQAANARAANARAASAEADAKAPGSSSTETSERD